MNKVLKVLGINIAAAASVFFGFTLSHFSVSAHPIDVSSVDLYVNHDVANEVIPENQMDIVVGISWQQAAVLVEQATKEVVKQPTELTKYDSPYYEYYASHIKVSNNGAECTIRYVDVPDRTEEEIVFGTGVNALGVVTCPDKLDNLSLMVSLFATDTPTQTNYVTIYDSPDTTVIGGLLTSSKTAIDFDLNTATPSGSSANSVNGSSPFLTRLTEQLTEAQGRSLLWAMGIVFLIGLLHTLEAGHSKVIISSYMLQKKATLRNGFWYVAIFTLTHLADIIVLGVIFLVVDSIVDINSRLSFLQAFSTYTLVAIAVYMLFKNLSEFLQHRLKHLKGHKHDHDHEHTHDHGHSHDLREDIPLREQLMMGVVTGLAPCLVGWGIFFIVLRSGQLWTFIPMILAFGLGIFIALMVVVWLVQTFKKPVFGKLAWIGEISPILSALLLLAFSLSALL